MILEVDIFDFPSAIVPLLAKDTILTDRLIAQLKQQGVKDAWVAGLNEPMMISLPPPQPLLCPQLKKDALQNLQQLFYFFEHEQTAEHHVLGILKDLDAVVEQMVQSLQQNERTLVHIADLKSYDDYTYHHSLSVAVLSIAIGQALNLDRRQLNTLGKCAMMHDIGKTAIPLQIINKPSRLNAEEFAIVKRHSPEGYQYLSKYNIDDATMLAGVLFHHEKYDGSGYPYGLKGEKIPLISRIISAADVYDALTSQRSYRSPQPPHEALEYILGNAGQAFDYDVVLALMKKLELYPAGSLVKLSNGQRAVVLESEHTLRPRIKLLESGRELDLYRDRGNLNLTITNPITQRLRL